MTSSPFGRIDRRHLVASTIAGGTAILTAGRTGLAQTPAATPETPSASPVAEIAPDGVPMFRGNAARTGEMPGPAPDDANGVEVIWSFPTGGQLRTPPAVVDGTAFFGSGDGNFYAVSVHDGTERWRFATGGGFASGPAVADGIVFFGSGDGFFYALDATTGDERWRFDVGAHAASPAVAEGMVLVGGGEQFDMTLFALDIEDGTERWRFANDSAWNLTPAIAGDLAYICTGSVLYALNLLTGEEFWRATISDSGNDWFGPEIAVANDTVYVPGSLVVAFDAHDGTERWRSTPDEFITGAIAVAGDTVVAGSVEYHTVAAANALDGRGGWLYFVGDTEPDPDQPSRYGFSNVAIADETVFATRAFNEVYAIDLADGSERWMLQLHAGGKNYLTAPVVVDGVVLVGSSFEEEGVLHAIGARVPVLGIGGTARVIQATSLRGGPAASAVERGSLEAGTVVTITGASETSATVTWWPVRVNDTGAEGWVEEPVLEPLTSGPDPETMA